MARHLKETDGQTSGLQAQSAPNLPWGRQPGAKFWLCPAWFCSSTLYGNILVSTDTAPTGNPNRWASGSGQDRLVVDMTHPC